MLNAYAMLRDVGDTARAHEQQPCKPKNRVRKWDGETPYFVHPTWCAMTVYHETRLPTRLRLLLARMLQWHDVLEDTTRGKLPLYLSSVTRRAVTLMCFDGGFAEEQTELWKRGPIIILGKLYDKVSNWMDGAWMSEEKRNRLRTHILNICDVVGLRFAKYGTLNIVTIARALVA